MQQQAQVVGNNNHNQNITDTKSGGKRAAPVNPRTHTGVTATTRCTHTNRFAPKIGVVAVDCLLTFTRVYRCACTYVHMYTCGIWLVVTPISAGTHTSLAFLRIIVFVMLWLWHFATVFPATVVAFVALRN